jgi:hypothetical protein
LFASISFLPFLPRPPERDGKLVPTDPLLVGFLTNFASFLLLFPGHPEHGPFHLVKGLLNVVKSFKAWCVPVLCCAQPKQVTAFNVENARERNHKMF